MCISTPPIYGSIYTYIAECCSLGLFPCPGGPIKIGHYEDDDDDGVGAEKINGYRVVVKGLSEVSYIFDTEYIGFNHPGDEAITCWHQIRVWELKQQTAESQHLISLSTVM